jgi:hypothetical protein
MGLLQNCGSPFGFALRRGDAGHCSTPRQETEFPAPSGFSTLPHAAKTASFHQHKY